MSAHCHCADHERDPYIREQEITVGVAEGSTTSKERFCGNCGGLIEVIA